MSQLWRVFSYLVALHHQGYSGRVELSWKDGVIQHTRTDSSRVPDDLPGDDDGLVDLLAHAKRTG